MNPQPAQSLAADREFCRGVLPGVSRTFAVNIGLLGGSLGESVRIAYLLCRAADAIEDSWGGTATDLNARFEAFLAALDGDAGAARSLAGEAGAHAAGRSDLGLLAALPRVLAVHRALPDSDRLAVTDGVRTLASGMCRYAVRATTRDAGLPYLDDDAELHDYCYVVAGCVGVMLTRLFEPRIGPEEPARREARRKLAPIVGEALQLTNILLDLPTDVRQGRCYLPATWLARHGLVPAQLTDVRIAAVRELALRLEALAHAALDQVPDYLDTLPTRMVRVRLFCLWPAMWARASVRLAHREPAFPWSAERPRLSRSDLWWSAARSLLTAHDPRGVRRLMGATPVSL
jgi:farnesyl-diphosphate farnesyltransferase